MIVSCLLFGSLGAMDKQSKNASEQNTAVKSTTNKDKQKINDEDSMSDDDGNEDSKAKQHSCTFKNCNKSFKKKSELIRHERVHTGEKPYSCPTCSTLFADPSALKKHTRIHNNDLRYPCIFGECGQAFTDASALARHIELPF